METMVAQSLQSFYQGKRVFVTGHTGFKGTWLCWWLTQLGAEVTGYALPPEGARNLFDLTSLAGSMHHIQGDVRDADTLNQALQLAKPDMVMHLAAQALVLPSYEAPVDSYASNVMGTVHLLEAARHCDSAKATLIVTTDKCYENKEWPWPYRETDALGGHAPYSSSKAMAEIAASAYYRSFMAAQGKGVATARAGNIIGGGDFSEYRILPDIFRAIEAEKTVELRNPHAVRPWQHVLDALHGYLLLTKALYEAPGQFSEAYNFSPHDASLNFTVEYITKIFIAAAGRGDYKITSDSSAPHEARFLQLDASKALQNLHWQTKLSTQQAIELSAEWYQLYLEDNAPAQQLTLDHITHTMENYYV